MALMADSTGLSFKTTKERKRLAKILAARLDKADVSTLLNDLLQREIDRYFPLDIQRQLLSEPESEDEAQEDKRFPFEKRKR